MVRMHFAVSSSNKSNWGNSIVGTGEKQTTVNNYMIATDNTFSCAVAYSKCTLSTTIMDK